MALASSRKRTLVIKEETTRGTSIIGSMANADSNIPWFDIQVSKSVEVVEGKYAAGDHDHFASIPGKRMATVTARAHYKWSGTVDTAPALTKLLKAAGALETVNASTSVVWTPDKAKDAITHSILIQSELVGGTPSAVGIQIKGAMCNIKIIMEQPGAPWIIEAEFTGALVDVVDIANGAILVATGIDTPNPDSILSSSVSWGGVAKKITSLELDFGNVVEMEEDQSDSTGYLAAFIAERNPVINFNPKIDLVATDDNFGQLVNSTEAVFAASSSHLAIGAQKAQIISLEDAVQGSAIAYQLQLRLNRVSGGTPWTLTHS